MEENKEPNLGTRALNARKAVSCCESNVTKLEFELGDVLGQFLAGALSSYEAGPGVVLAFVPAGRPTIPPPVGKPAPPVTRTPPRVILAPARLLPVGAVIVGGVTVIEAIAKRTAALETAASMVDLVTEFFKARRLAEEDRENCEACVKKNIWSQSKKQVPEFKTVRTRV
jgi:hypothetical protein